MAKSWQHIATYRSNGGAAGPSTVLGEGLLVGVGALSGVGHAVLGLPVLGQVEGGDLLRLLDLLLVGLDLALQLVDQGLHPLVILAVLILLVAQLLDLALAVHRNGLKQLRCWCNYCNKIAMGYFLVHPGLVHPIIFVGDVF